MKLRIQFPHVIEQTDDHAVEIKLADSGVPVFSNEWLHHIEKVEGLSLDDIDKVVDESYTFLRKQIIMRQIRIFTMEDSKP